MDYKPTFWEWFLYATPNENFGWFIAGFEVAALLFVLI